jgi:DNA-binding NarL/FixJ family response regulator
MPMEPTPVTPVTSHVPSGSRIPVLLVDDHPALRVGARKLIDDEPDMAVVAEARTAEEALSRSGFPMGVAVVDYHLGHGHDGLWLTAQLKRLEQPPGVLVYSAFADNTLTVMALIAGADGLLDKRQLGQELASAIRRLARGGRYLPAVSSPLAGALRSRLDGRDQAIFGMLLHATPPEVIMQRLGVTPDELNVRRSIILKSLSSGRRDISVPSRADGPLDYDRPRRAARRWAA